MQEKRKNGAAEAAPLYRKGRLTAAAADEHQCDDENPDPVVVKNVAKTVVHGIPPKYEIAYLRNNRRAFRRFRGDGDLPLPTIIICRGAENVRAF